jgi:hypothetical protein
VEESKGKPSMRSHASDICVLCAKAPATTVEHVPAQLFFDRPLPSNLITVPACPACNQGSQHDDEYLRAFIMLLRDSTPSESMEKVRARTYRQLHREGYGGLRKSFQEASELRWETGLDGLPVVGLFTKPDSERLMNVMTKYARGLHFWSTGNVLSVESRPSIERIFNMATRPNDYWEPLLAAAAFVRQGTVAIIGAEEQFNFAFRPVNAGDCISVMVLEFYRSFPYVVMMLKPGTDPEHVRLPFQRHQPCGPRSIGRTAEMRPFAIGCFGS